MIRCKKCGTLNEADATFCSQCDAFLEWSGEHLEGDGGDSQAETRVTEPSSAAADVDAPAARRPDTEAASDQASGPGSRRPFPEPCLFLAPRGSTRPLDERLVISSRVMSL